MIGSLAALIVLGIVFSFLSPYFATYRNVSQVTQQVMEVGTLAVGQTLIIMTAGIDLSVGAIMIFGTVVIARLAVFSHVPVELAIAAGFGITIGLSTINGLAIARFKLPPFIVTLGMLNIAYACTLLYSSGTEIQGLPPSLLKLGESFVVGGVQVPIGPLVMLGVVIAAWYGVSQTAWGHHLRALGSSSETARLAGLNTTVTLMSVYAIAGAIYGIASLLSLGREAIADPLGGPTDNLESITAVVIGGTSLFGGRGTIVGTLIGALIVGVIRNGLTLVGVDALWQNLATGFILVGAVALDQSARGGRGLMRLRRPRGA
jgi:fructose transport system permease protein